MGRMRSPRRELTAVLVDFWFLGWGNIGSYLKKTACGVAYPHGQDALPQERIDGGGLAIAGTPKERHLHVVSFQHLSNTRHPSAYAHKPMVILTRA